MNVGRNNNLGHTEVTYCNLLFWKCYVGDNFIYLLIIQNNNKIARVLGTKEISKNIGLFFVTNIEGCETCA